MIRSLNPVVFYNLLFAAGDPQFGCIFILLDRLRDTLQTQIEPSFLFGCERDAGHAL